MCDLWMRKLQLFAVAILYKYVTKLVEFSKKLPRIVTEKSFLSKICIIKIKENNSNSNITPQTFFLDQD